jgi:hypothetical protein
MEHEMTRYYVRGEDGLLHWIIDYPGMYIPFSCPLCIRASKGNASSFHINYGGKL